MIKKSGAIGLIAKMYLLVLGIFSIIRILFFINQLHRLNATNNKISDILQAFIMGVRFDVAISGYILILPALILLLLDIFKKQSKYIHRFLFWWLFLLFSVTFFVSAADIAYFDQFFSHVSMGVFEWADSPAFVAKMILQEPKIYLFLVLGIVAILIFYRLLKRVFVQTTPNKNANVLLQILKTLGVLALLFLGIRGRISKKSPLQVGTAYFCNDPYINQLGLNANFVLIRSYLDELQPIKRNISLMDNQEAIKNVQTYLKVDTSSLTQTSSPIARKITPPTTSKKKYNVILILMESMSADKMARHGNTSKITPFLDSLANESYYFEHCYSAGEHTFNGIFSTLFSFPAIYRKHPLFDIKSYNGLSKTLFDLGYQTAFITTHDTQFDNMEAFMLNNYTEKVYGQKNYPSSEIKTSLGVTDHFMFDFALPVLDKMSQKNRPFFTTILTASDHLPYYIPDYFKAYNSTADKQITEFADWSLQHFFAQASKKPWFDNTIFVLVADHGKPTDVKYDISLNFHHVPLIIYAPKLIQPKVISKISGQIDCFPTIMGLLQQPYTNSTLGVDLLHESRPYIFINGDDKFAALDKEWLLILKDDNSFKLHKYNDKDQKNYADDFPEKVQKMLIYMKANLQTYQYISNHTNSFK